ncbi:hypothetical protein [Prescottella subtropica]|uniref:hypothetical protein n=1 Tax=Prescottella subtropica TaxID=2545757 RepID=UPI0010F6BE66|nr:hypothetical protein [Prescottella subtropica]
MRKALPAVALLALGLIAASAAPAGAADPSWSGEYSLKRFAATKSGTSLAARQGEPDFADTYTFTTDCAAGTCVATVVDGPTPANPTLPLPPQYTWDGTSWVHVYDWQWDCWQGEGVPKVWTPAHSVAVYTPRPDGTLTGTWRTDITGGPCDGSVIMDVAAYPAAPPQSVFGSGS